VLLNLDRKEFIRSPVPPGTLRARRLVAIDPCRADPMLLSDTREVELPPSGSLVMCAAEAARRLGSSAHKLEGESLRSMGGRVPPQRSGARRRKGQDE